MITHDTRCALDAVVDLLNTAPEGEAPGAPDSLADLAALGEFVRRNDISDVGTLGTGDLSAVRSLRERFAQIFAAGDDRTRPSS